MVESAGTVFGVEPGQQIRHAGERGQAAPPAFPAVASAEFEPRSKRSSRILTPVEQVNDRLRQNEREVLFQAFAGAHALVRHGVIRARDVYPDLVASHFDREDANIVSPWVERSATGQVEASVVPVAGQDAVLHTASIERESHMRAAVVYRVDTLPMANEEKRVAGDRSHLAARRPDVGQTPGAYKLRDGRPRTPIGPNRRAFEFRFLSKVLEIVAQVLRDLI